MIGKALVFLRQRLDSFLRAELGTPDDPSTDKLVFLDGDKLDPLVFTPGAVSMLLINVEEERLLRDADPYTRRAQDGSPLRVHPDVRLMVYLLFVARFKQYDSAWSHLAKVIEYFQANPIFCSASAPDLPASVEQLVLELTTLRFAEQNEVWSSLRAVYHPSILYRAKLICLRDTKPVAVGATAETVIKTSRMS